MREIEFRGRALKSKLWVRGYYWTNENGNHFIRQTVDLNGCFRIADIEVDPETVGQYTGLKDKNGVKIYEGDIITNGDKNIKYIVEWNDTGFKARQWNNKSYIGLEYWKNQIEVIGNIHDNPELLELGNYADNDIMLLAAE